MKRLGELELTAVLHALSDPMRLEIVAALNRHHKFIRGRIAPARPSRPAGP